MDEPKREGPYVPYSEKFMLRLRPAQMEQIEALAVRLNTTKSQVIRCAVRKLAEEKGVSELHRRPRREKDYEWKDMP